MSVRTVSTAVNSCAPTTLGLTSVTVGLGTSWLLTGSPVIQVEPPDTPVIFVSVYRGTCDAGRVHLTHLWSLFAHTEAPMIQVKYTENTHL